MVAEDPLSTQNAFLWVFLWAKSCVVPRTKYPVAVDVDHHAPQLHSSSTSFDLVLCCDTDLQCKCKGGKLGWFGRFTSKAHSPQTKIPMKNDAKNIWQAYFYGWVYPKLDWIFCEQLCSHIS